MGSQRLSLALTIVNLVVLALVVANVTGFPAPAAATVGEASPARHQEVAAVLRGRELELVDRNGRVRSRLNVEPSGDVVLRLIDQNGTIRVKLGAGEGPRVLGAVCEGRKLRHGRGLGRGSPLYVWVNERLARNLRGGDTLGERVRRGDNGEWWEIAGV